MKNTTKAALLGVSITNTSLPQTADLEKSPAPLSPVINWRLGLVIILTAPALYVCRHLFGW